MLRWLPTFPEAGAAGHFPVGFGVVVRMTFGHRTPLLCKLLQHDAKAGRPLLAPGGPFKPAKVPGCFLHCRAEPQEKGAGTSILFFCCSGLPYPPPREVCRLHGLRPGGSRAAGSPLQAARRMAANTRDPSLPWESACPFPFCPKGEGLGPCCVLRGHPGLARSASGQSAWKWGSRWGGAVLALRLTEGRIQSGEGVREVLTIGCPLPKVASVPPWPTQVLWLWVSSWLGCEGCC